MPFRPCRSRQTVALQLHWTYNCLGSCFASPPTPWYPQTDPPLCFKSVNSHRDGAPRGRHPCNSRCFCLKAAILLNVVAFSPSCFRRVSTVRSVQIVICTAGSSKFPRGWLTAIEMLFPGYVLSSQFSLKVVFLYPLRASSSNS